MALVLGIELPSKVGRVIGDRHRRGCQDEGDRGASDVVVRRHPVDGVADDRRDGDIPTLRLNGDLAVTALVQQQVDPVVEIAHAHTLAHDGAGGKTGVATVARLRATATILRGRAGRDGSA